MFESRYHIGFEKVNDDNRNYHDIYPYKEKKIIDIMKWLDKDNKISFESIDENHKLFKFKYCYEGMNYDQIEKVYKLLK